MRVPNPTIVVAFIAFHSVAADNQPRCRWQNDPSFTSSEREIVETAQKYAKEKSGRTYSCFWFSPPSSDGGFALHLDYPLGRDGKPTVGIGNNGFVVFSKDKKIVRWEGGR